MISFGKEQQVTRTITKCREFSSFFFKYREMGRAEMGRRRRRKIILLWPVCRHAVLGGTDGRSGSFLFLFFFHLCVSANWTSPHSNSHTPTQRGNPWPELQRRHDKMNKRDDLAEKIVQNRLLTFVYKIPPAQGPPFKNTRKLLSARNLRSVGKIFVSWVDRQNWRHLLSRLLFQYLR